MQETVDEDSALGFCKAEFQAFMQHFVGPLMERTMRLRYAREARAEHKALAKGLQPKRSCGGKTFCEVYKEWEKKLSRSWDQGVQLKHGDGPVPKGHWRTFANVPLSAYKPSKVPYFITFDRGAFHSFWVGKNQEKHLAKPGVPLLQLMIMPPRGHDIHQIPEHAIGATKGHVAKELGKLRANNKRLTTGDCYTAVEAGSRLYKKESWEKNLKQLQICLEIVAAPKGTQLKVPVTRKDREGNEIIETRPVYGTAGGFCPKPWC